MLTLVALGLALALPAKGETVEDCEVLAATVTPSTLPAGTSFKVRYHFTARRPLSTAYSVFVHFRAETGDMAFQGDHLPPVGTGTPGWQGHISYELPVIIPMDLPAGTYRIIVGLYNENGRARIKAGAGATDAGDGSSYHVGTFTIDPAAARPEADTEQDKSLDLTGYRMRFDESFDGPLDVSAWGPGTRWIAHTPWAGDFGDARFADPAPGFPFTISNGVLRIEARKDTDGPWRAGLLASNDPKGNGFSQQYGYFEMRAKLPPGPGVWPAFWLCSSYDRTDPDAGETGSVEIDALEYYGHNPNAYTATMHVWSPKPHYGHGSSITTREHEASTGFHDYGVLVEPMWTTMYFDQVEVWKTRTPKEHNKPLMILLNLALGSGWPIDQTPNPSFMYVDHVRAWSRAPSGLDTPPSLHPAGSALAPGAANPILPGYHADPSLIEVDGVFYLYTTLDPWGGDLLGCWESPDFKQWTYRTLDWPSKQACTSPTSSGTMVWAPSVDRGKDGTFYMYISVGSEVWAGVADHPLGPWSNLLGDRPLIAHNDRPGYHMIDADAFIDDDGQAYLYWGSGWNWVNGRCWAVKLKDDMVTFDGPVEDVTPAHYFEAPHLVKHEGRYFLMYSDGNTTRDTYQVHYAVGDTPMGPFTEAANSPILFTDHANHVVSPGHHTVFTHQGRTYILYHRHSVPFDPDVVGRQVCVDALHFTPDGLIERVAPTHSAPALAQGRVPGFRGLAASASSQANAHTGPGCAVDDNYATRWASDPEEHGAWLQLDLGRISPFSRLELRPEFAWKAYRFSVKVSDDGQSWRTLINYREEPAQGSPILVEQAGTARFLRLTFPEPTDGTSISLWEWTVR